MDDLSMTSKILNMERKYAIYLPPDYATSKRSYPVLYLLHGAGDDQTGWVQFGEVLHITDQAISEGTATPMIIVMPDADTGQRGYFNDPKGNWRYEDFFFEEFMPFIEKTYRIKGQKRYRAVAGLSMGGYLSFEILRQAPDRVEALILLDTSARGETEAQTARRHELIELARAEGIDPVIEQLLPYFVDEDNVAQLRDTVVKMARDTGVDAFVRQETAIASRVSSLEMLPQILCPTPVIVGGRDRLTAPEVNQEIADNVPGAEYYRIDRCGHLSTLEAPARVNEIMRHALRL